MPLRDHFRPPVWNKSSWEGFHGGWPMTIVQRLNPLLPEQFAAEPRAHLGAYYEIDVCAFDEDEPRTFDFSSEADSGGVATMTKVTPEPTLTLEADLLDEYEYEVLVYDHGRAHQLVAAIGLVSPANKDRKKSRRAFVTKCASLLQQGVCVSIVDLVTVRKHNLYAELLKSIEKKDPAFSPTPPATYAVTCRARKLDHESRLDIWAYPLVVGQPIPALPIWLAEDFHVMLDLEGSYEDACRALKIR